MDILNESSIDKLEAGYANTDPFPFIVIDNFLKDAVINEIKSSVDNLITKAANYHCPVFWEHNKYAFTKDHGTYLNNIFMYFISDEFITYIEKLTGISGLIRNDSFLEGAGIHRITNGGYLNVHTDFKSYISLQGRVYRRVNLLLYLNPDWKDEYGGQLLLCNQTSVKYKIQPLLNRVVIFNTPNALHGHPYPLNVPDSITRQSIAIYYYTKDDASEYNELENGVRIYDTSQFNLSNITVI